MFSVKTEQEGDGLTPEKAEVAVRKTFVEESTKTAEMMMERIRDTIKQVFNGWIAPEEALDAYPSLLNIEKFIDGYTQSLVYEMDEEPMSIEVRVDAAKLRSKGISPDLIQALEFGTVQVPIMSHWRPMMTELDELVNRTGVAIATHLTRTFRNA
jgi:hypothetical protein